MDRPTLNTDFETISLHQIVGWFIKLQILEHGPKVEYGII
jgi:hypothetical protein